MTMYEQYRISCFVMLYTVVDKDSVLKEPIAFLGQKFWKLYMIIVGIFVIGQG